MSSSTVFRNPLNVFGPPQSDLSFDREYVVETLPTTFTSDMKMIEFQIPGNSSSYLDLYNSQIQAVIRVFKGDGSEIDATSNVSITNLPIHSLFQHAELEMNGLKMTCNHYHYKTYLDTLLNESAGKLESDATKSGFYKDEGVFRTAGALSLSNNSGAFYRASLIKDSRECQLLGDLSKAFDFAGQSRLLPNGVGVVFRFYPASQDLFLLNGDIESDETKTYKLKIEKMKLLIHYIELKPSYSLAIESEFSISQMLYPFLRSDIRTYNLHKDSSVMELTNVFTGRIPARMTVVLINQENFVGSQKTNPLYFEHANISNITLCIDSQDICPRHDTDFEQGLFSTAFNSLSYQTNVVDTGGCIKTADFSKGYTIFTWCLDSNLATPNLHPVSKRGDVRLTIRFNTATTETYTVLIYGQFPAVGKLTKSRFLSIQE